MKTENSTSDLVNQFYADRNCSAFDWIANEPISDNQKQEFLLSVLVDTWQKAFLRITEQARQLRLKELLTWDKPKSNNDVEHKAKIQALQNILTS